jgi:hypothetical protein
MKKKAMEHKEKKKVDRLRKILAAKIIIKAVKKWFLKLKGRKVRL